VIERNDRAEVRQKRTGRGLGMELRAGIAQIPEKVPQTIPTRRRNGEQSPANSACHREVRGAGLVNKSSPASAKPPPGPGLVAG